MASSPLRTLFYKQQFGPILIDKIEQVDKNKFYSSVVIPPNAIIYDGPITPAQRINPVTRLIENIYLPIMSDVKGSLHQITFDQWLHGRLFISNDEVFTREELIKFIANQDGGGHVDDGLTAKYYNMVHNLYSANMIPSNIKVSNLHLALLRQVVHETLYSFQKMHLLSSKYSGSTSSKHFSEQNLMPFELSHMSISTGSDEDKETYF